MQNNNYLVDIIAKKAAELSSQAESLSLKITEYLELQAQAPTPHDGFVDLLTIFVLSCIVGYFVVWKVTPALHTPLMSITNAISGIIVIGALLVTGSEEVGIATIFSVLAIFLASVNIFGGFLVTKRMLSMFERR